MRNCALSFILFLVLTSRVFPAVIQSAATGNWNAGATWVGGNPPLATDDVVIRSGHTVTLNVNATCVNLTVGNGSTAASLTHAATTNALTVNGTVTMFQPTGNNTTNSWIINAGSATVSGLITFAGTNTTTSRIGRITLTTGTLNANGGMTFTGSASATKVIDMSAGACTLNLKGALTVPANSSTLTAGTAGSLFNYNDAVAQTINYFSSGGYFNLSINNTSASGATLSAAITTTRVTGNLSVGNISAGSLLNTGNFNIALANSRTVTVAANSTMNGGTSVVTFGTTASVTVNGTFKTANTNGFSGSTTTAINSTNTPTITLGASSTIEYDNASAVQIATARTDYANVTLTGLSKTIGTAAGQTVTLSQNLTINTGATYNGATRNPILNIGGDFSNSGTFTQGTSLVTFNGTAAQTILGSSATTFSNNVTLNNPAGLSITTSPTINGLLTFSNGKITTGANKLILGSAATTSGAAAGRYVYGNLEIFIPNAAGPSRTFIIGDATNYTPVLIAFSGTTSGSGSLIAYTTAGDDPDIDNSGINSALSVNRTWNVSQGSTPVGGFTSYSGTFTFVAGDIDGGANTNNFVVRKYEGTSWAATTTGTRTATTTQATGMTTFGKYQVGEPRTITVATQPSNSTICAGSNTSFNSTSTSIPTPTVKWQRGNPGYTDISAALDAPNTTYSDFTTTTLTLTGSETPINGYLYRAVFININGSVNSNAATLTVNASPTITSNPSNQTVCISQNANFTVTTSAGSPTYQWQMSSDAASWVNVTSGTPAGVTYTNQTTATLTANGTSTVSLYYYRCVVTAAGCSRNSNSATLTINTVPSAAGAISGSNSVCQGQAGVAYSVAAIAGATSYTWAYSGTGVTFSSNPSAAPNITIDFSGSATSGNLTVMGTNSCGNGAVSPNYSITVVAGLPGAAGAITGTSSVCQSQQYPYSVAPITGAASYTWAYSGTGFTPSDNSASINGGFSPTATSGNLTVVGVNGCGSGTPSPNYAITVSACPPHGSATVTCNGCHMNHSDPVGGPITASPGNSNLCISCHNPAGTAWLKPFDNSQKAVPGTSGNSHSWDNPIVNATFETNTPDNPQATQTDSMSLRLPDGKIICSTCHNQHTTAPASPFLRVSNTGDAMCKDCHDVRNRGLYTSDPVNNKGTHPVGVIYPVADSRFNAAPVDSVLVVGGNIECTSCHKQHYAPFSNGYILRSANSNEICTKCHVGNGKRVNLIHKGQTCRTCHQPHNTNKANIYLIRDNIQTPSSGLKPVVFTSNAAPGNYAVGGAPYNGVCEVCHTATDHYQNTTPGTADARHVPSPQKCVNCHPHTSAFYPQASCFDCHNAVAGSRRQIVDATGDGLGAGGDFKRTSHHVNGSIPNVSDCNLCHYMGDHKSGTVKLLDPDNGYLSIITYDPLNKASVEDFCLNCHDANGADGDATPFSDGATVPVFNKALWDASAHKANPYTCLDCHDNGHGSNKRNILGPYNYAGPGTGTDVTNEEEGFCLTCHGAGGVATVKVHLAFSSYTNTATNFYKHDPNGTYRIHDRSESTGAAFTGANRHIECVDCHNPHGVKTGTATAPTLLPTLTGAKGVNPTYSGIGAPTGFTWQSSVSYEYQVCYKCHSSFTTLPSYSPGGWNQTAIVADGLRKLTTNTNGQIQDSRDMAKEFNPSNVSFHPVMAVGTNDGINSATFQAGWDQTSRVYCSDCHNNPNKATSGHGSGPHGSVNLHILDGVVTSAANYKTAHNTGTASSTSEVCIKCHQAGSYNTASNNSNFGLHDYHMQNPVVCECYVCHDIHGNEQYHLINFNRNEASCNITWMAPATNSQNSFVHAVGAVPQQCDINCHGTSHGSGKQYTPGSAGCTACHNAINTPTAGIFTTDAHNKHTKGIYTFPCSTCHLNYGMGGSLELPSHPNGTENVNFDPNGLARRNGLDANTPAFTSGPQTCDNVYCHSNGKSAHRGSDANYNWGGTIGPSTYIATPSWDVGTITTCACHGGQGNMASPYTITTGSPLTQLIENTSEMPAIDNHQHNMLDNDNGYAPGWPWDQCFWCHSTNNAPGGSPNYQGTYSTAWHIDGQTYLNPKLYSNGGTFADFNQHAADGSAAHCGSGKTCW